MVERTLAALPPGGCPAWMGSNHDIGRFPSRWCRGDERKIRLALLVLATLPSTTVLYYGDEIGMTDVDVPVGCAGTARRLPRRRPPPVPRCGCADGFWRSGALNSPAASRAMSSFRPPRASGPTESVR